MTEYVFELPVEPVAQMRPRFTCRPYVHAYDPVKVKGTRRRWLGTITRVMSGHSGGLCLLGSQRGESDEVT